VTEIDELKVRVQQEHWLAMNHQAVSKSHEWDVAGSGCASSLPMGHCHDQQRITESRSLRARIAGCAWQQRSLHGCDSPLTAIVLLRLWLASAFIAEHCHCMSRFLRLTAACKHPMYDLPPSQAMDPYPSPSLRPDADLKPNPKP